MDAILEEAMELIVREGIDGWTMQQLARRVDFTPGALYRYFDAKASIIVALESQVPEDFHEILNGTWAMIEEWLPTQGLTESDRVLVPVIVAPDTYRELSVERAAQFQLPSTLLGDPRQLVEDSIAVALQEPTLALFGGLSIRIELATESRGAPEERG